MMTKENTHPNKKFMADLERAGVDVTSGIARQALDDFRRGVSADQAIAKAVSHQNTVMQRWVSTALEPWCNRHGITLEQGLSIAFDDSPFNPKTKKDDLPTVVGFLNPQHAVLREIQNVGGHCALFADRWTVVKIGLVMAPSLYRQRFPHRSPRHSVLPERA